MIIEKGIKKVLDNHVPLCYIDNINGSGEKDEKALKKYLTIMFHYGTYI